MEAEYIYQKKRNEFGRQCCFTDTATILIDDCKPDKKATRNYIWRDPYSQAVGGSPMQASQVVNTARAIYHNTGTNHTEGGWPKDVNYLDEESTARYRRKLQKEDHYNPSILALGNSVMDPLLENNAINIYEEYFTDVEILPSFTETSARIINVFKSSEPSPFQINSISWSPKDANNLAITYCNWTYQYMYKKIPDIDIFEMQNPHKPICQLAWKSPATCTEFHLKDSITLVSGLLNGQLVVWDTRRGRQPVGITSLEMSHRGPVSGLIWLPTKSGMEFFSSSIAGEVKFWDTRRLDRVIEKLVVDFVKDEEQLVSNSMGISSLEYDAGIPTRFMLGTEHGYVISCNRKGKTGLEKMSAKYFAHYGPVLRVHRNGFYAKNFLTIGDWSLKIFAEECKESPIWWTNFYKFKITDAGWSPLRYSTYFTTRSDGVLDIWDVLQNLKAPLASVKLSEKSLTHMKIQDSGAYIAIGTSDGVTFIVELSENLLSSTKSEKLQLQSFFDREVRREKILEVRNREIRLKLKTKSAEVVEGVKSQIQVDDVDLQEVENEYYELVEIEKAKCSKLNQKKEEEEIEL